MLRIVAGEFRGRKIHTSTGEWLRPTADRMKETIFNVLQDAFPGARVLDLYAGTGNLGLEAWSRGARQVVWVEKNKQGVELIHKNLGHLGLSPGPQAHDRMIEVVQDSSCRFLQESNQAWDVILADPPYDAGEEDSLVQLFQQLNPAAGYLVLQHGKQWVLDPALTSLELYRQRRFGETTVEFLKTKEGSDV